jgi:alkylation response protein AidB-like acyl-CoA dehydrogenase
MDFSFSEEQLMLRDQARSFLSERVPADRVVELAESDTPFDETLWKEMAGLGWTGLSVSEEHGGSGMGFLDEAILFEELGYALYPGPYLSSIGVALPLLSDNAEAMSAVASGDATVAVASTETDGAASLTEVEGLATRATKDGDAWSIEGVKTLVPDAGVAGRFVVTAKSDDGPGVWLVDASADGVSVESLETMDSTRRLGKVTFSGARAELLSGPDESESRLKSVRLRALASVALEAVGIAQKALDLALDYVKERKQFDKPIGVYQAVSHQVANTYMDVELARSLAYWAAWTVALDDDQAAAAVPAAKAAATETAVTACERSIQVHGGIGFTWEHILHRYYKRAQWLDSFEGFGPRQRKDVAKAILDAK